MQAVFNDTVIADSVDTVVGEGNHYFPSDSLRSEYVRPSRVQVRAAHDEILRPSPDEPRQ